MNEKTSINSIYPNLWAPTAGLLQGLTIMQQCAYRDRRKLLCLSKPNCLILSAVYLLANYTGWPRKNGATLLYSF